MSLVITAAPTATLIIMGIAFVIAFINSGINRGLISYFIGWDKYRTMQKEMAEYRSETMAAMRANDKKQVEKLKNPKLKTCRLKWQSRKWFNSASHLCTL
jgi:uncharacterized membrane protein (DUF106 family)